MAQIKERKGKKDEREGQEIAYTGGKPDRQTPSWRFTSSFTKNEKESSLKILVDILPIAHKVLIVVTSMMHGYTVLK